jgi:hypothetical protein
VGAAAGVSADQDPPAQAAGQLREREPGDLDMVGGGVGPGASVPEHDRQRLAVPARAVVGEGGQGVEAERPLPGSGGLLLLRVRDHDGGVQVDGDQAAAGSRGRVPGQRPRPLPGCRPGAPDRFQRPGQVRGQLADQPGHHRVGRDRARELRLLSQHRDIRQAVAAQRDRRGQVGHDLARVVDRPWRPPPGQPARQAPAQAGDPHRLPQQDRPGLRDQPPAVSGHRDAASTCAILHLESAFGSGTDRTLDKPHPPRSKALFHLH